MESSRQNSSTWIILKNNWEYIMAFFLPVCLMLVYCVVHGIWIFGEKSLLTGDAQNQYLPLFQELWQQVHDGGIHFFSWNAVGGFDFYQNLLYYMFSPTTIVVLLFPKNCIEDVLSFFLIFKWALLGFTSVYFFMHTKWNPMNENRRLIAFSFGMAYTCSTFFINMIMFFNWLDSFILFPILLLLVERMAATEKWHGYCLCLFITIICNFYIAFPICIFLILWFLIQEKNGNMLRKWVAFIGSSVLAAAMSAITIMPGVLNVTERYTVSNTAMNSESHIVLLQNPIELIKSFFIFGSVGKQSTGILTPNLYFSIGLIGLAGILFFVKVKGKKKIILLTILVGCSIVFADLNYVWHGFSQPHGIGNRFGFCFIMLLLLSAVCVLEHIQKITLRQLSIVTLLQIGLLCICFLYCKDKVLTTAYLWTFLLLVLYFLFTLLLICKKITKQKFIMIFLAFVLSEICINTLYQFGSYALESGVDKEQDYAITTLLENANIQKKSRIEIASSYKNQGMKNNIPTMSGFVSYFNGDMGNLLFKTGMNLVEDAGVSYIGSTPILNVLFNIQYGVGKNVMDFSDCKKIKEDKEVKLFEMQHSASLGYLVDDNIMNWGQDDSTDFELQNEFARNVTNDDEDVFKFITSKTLNSSLLSNERSECKISQSGQVINHFTMQQNEEVSYCEFVSDEDMDLYAMVKATQGMMIYVLVDGEMVYQGENSVAQQLLHVGKIKKGQKIIICSYVTGQAGSEVNIGVQFAEFDDVVFQKVYDKLSESEYSILAAKNDCIDGSITCKKAGIMLTSIPASKGFSVYVDGEQVPYKRIANALIGVPLESGQHDVRFIYETPYAYMAIFISLCSILIFVLITTGEWIYKKNRK